MMSYIGFPFTMNPLDPASSRSKETQEMLLGCVWHHGLCRRPPRHPRGEGGRPHPQVK